MTSSAGRNVALQMVFRLALLSNAIIRCRVPSATRGTARLCGLSVRSIIIARSTLYASAPLPKCCRDVSVRLSVRLSHSCIALNPSSCSQHSLIVDQRSLRNSNVITMTCVPNTRLITIFDRILLYLKKEEHRYYGKITGSCDIFPIE